MTQDERQEKLRTLLTQLGKLLADEIAEVSDEFDQRDNAVAVMASSQHNLLIATCMAVEEAGLPLARYSMCFHESSIATQIRIFDLEFTSKYQKPLADRFTEILNTCILERIH